ncbi:MAG: c-type cytochrome [Cyclobacteriaceae bacterium]|nr:c-type cytochrome [Cyclobacteriaceae bacterium]UYN87664.1 MAG: c-type cytochrome [Cyclobacteriaceae bacterium]
MKKFFKWTSYLLFTIVLVVCVFYAYAFFSTRARLATKYDITLQPIDITSDSVILSEGARLMTIKGCRDCHGDDLGGKVWLDDPMLGRIVAPNLTRGRGGLPSDYTSHDWLTALKHGLSRNKTPLIIMPANEFSTLTQHDMNALIAYGQQLEDVDRELPKLQIGFLGYLLTSLDAIPMIPAEKIDHTRQLSKAIAHEVTVDFGKYLSVACEGCHRKNMKGGSPVAPGFPEVADITASGNVGDWSEAEFIGTLRTGKTPEGKILKQEEMPWMLTQHYTDVELKALYLYLKSL